MRRLWPGFTLSGLLADLAGESLKITVLGRPFYIDPHDNAISSQLLTKSVWEPEETRFMLGYLKNGMVFVDAGANIGYFTVLASDGVGREGRVIAFEPDPKSFALLKKNIQVNRCVNAVIEQKALANRQGVVKLYRASVNLGDHRIFKTDDMRNNGHVRASVDVEATPLDAYFKSSPRLDFIKMDIQGAEYMALQGMKRVLRENPNIVLLAEFWPQGLYEAGSSPAHFLEELEGLGFSTFAIPGGIPKKISRSEIREVVSRQGFINLIFSRHAYWH